ncbi:tyrosine-type recombinase/integrase [Paenibacillus sp. V4I3]
MHTSRIEHIFTRLGKQLGLEDFTPHILRHTFCHDLIIKDILCRLSPN